MGGSGFTLYEIILVLGIIVLLAGITLPMASWWMRNNALRQSAADVKIVLDRTRVHAVDNGLLYAFHFEPGGRRFLALPAEVPIVAAAGSGTGGASGAGTGGTSRLGGSTPAPGASPTAGPNGAANPNALPAVEYLFGELPEGIVFSTIVPLARSPMRLNPRMYETLPEAPLIDEVVAWSQPLIYEPDGTSADHVLEILVEDARHAVTLELRGLTGTIWTSDIHLESQTGVVETGVGR